MRLQARRVQSATNTHEVITARPVSPASDSIITIQYQELERGTGRPLGDLTALRFWESSEGDVLHRFPEGVPVFDQNPFVFVPVGYNLKFEYRFLLNRSHHYGLPAIDILPRPWVDLHGTGILMYGGEFRGSGLDDITRKKRSGGSVPGWYESREYQKIDAYVRDEAKAFIEFYVWLPVTMPDVRKRWNYDGQILQKRFFSSIGK